MRGWVMAGLLLAGCSGQAPAPPPVAPARAPVTAERPGAATDVPASTLNFGVALYKQLAGERGNVFVSPVSLAGAFGPVAAGARGETRGAILGALAVPDGLDLHPQLGGLLRGLERETPGTTLSIANALWPQQGFAIRPEFLRVARTDYDATVEPLDYRASGAAAERINAWVNRETRSRIPTIVTPDALGSLTRLVVTNAVYFLGDWADAFDVRATTQQPFFGPGGATRPVPLMARTDEYRLLETDAFQAVDLPYKDPRLSLSVFLPRARDGLSAFEAGLTDAGLRDALARLDAERPRDVRLHLPKFKAETSYSLIDPLTALGMGIAFDRNRADLRGIGDAQLYISGVFHKTFLRIDEKGTEAAAATAVVVRTVSRRPDPPVFRADHPFFLVLRDKTSGAVLFMGRIEAPQPA